MDATESILNFLEWSEPNEELFGQEVKIVLASAGFSKEVTTSVMWLNDFGLDIRCVRMRPYAECMISCCSKSRRSFHFPEIADHQIQIQEKRQEVRNARKTPKVQHHRGPYIVTQNLSKRHMILRLVSEAIHSGKTPDAIISCRSQRGPKKNVQNS